MDENEEKKESESVKKIGYWRVALRRTDGRDLEPRYLHGTAEAVNVYVAAFATFELPTVDVKMLADTDPLLDAYARDTAENSDSDCDSDIFSSRFRSQRRTYLDRLLETDETEYRHAADRRRDAAALWRHQETERKRQETERKRQEMERKRVTALERKLAEEATEMAKRVAESARRRKDEKAKRAAMSELDMLREETEQRRLWDVRMCEQHRVYQQTLYEKWVDEERKTRFEYKVRLEQAPDFRAPVARVVRVLSSDAIPDSDMLHVRVTTTSGVHFSTEPSHSLPPPPSQSLSHPSVGTADVTAEIDELFAIEPMSLHVYVPEERAILFSSASGPFYLPDIPEAKRRTPDLRVPESLSKESMSLCGGTRRRTMGVLAPFAWIYNNQSYFFGFPGEAIHTLLTKLCNMPTEIAHLTCEWLGRRSLTLASDITTLTRVQRISHYNLPTPQFEPCDCTLCQHSSLTSSPISFQQL
jgi:hypothetical protein